MAGVVDYVWKNDRFNYGGQYLEVGERFNAEMGYIPRVDVRAGELYQTRVVTEPVTHFGLGNHFKADVLRVQWPNGVPQTIYFPGTDQDVLTEYFKETGGPDHGLVILDSLNEWRQLGWRVRRPVP